MTAPDAVRSIFLHIHKTGGLTLRHFLLRRYGEAALFVPAPPGLGIRSGGPGQTLFVPPPDEGQNARLVEVFRALPSDKRDGIRLFTAHLSFGVHEQLPGPITYFTLLRDPIDRALSEYHARRVKGRIDMSLREYVLNLPHFGNQQTRRLAGGDWARASTNTDGMLDAAKQHLIDHFTVVGVTERWDETLLVLADTFGWGERPVYRRLNEGRGRPRREEIDDDVLAALHDQNRLDIELHRFARDRFEERLARDHPQIERQVDELRRANRSFQRLERAREPARRLRYLVRSTAARTYHRLRGS